MIELVLFSAPRLILGSKSQIGFRVEEPYIPIYTELLRKGIEKSHDRYDVTVKLPKRHRSTGPGSASHHYHGHANQIAGYLGYTPDQMKYIIKCEAGSMGYPSTFYKGLTIPQSEADASPEEESMLIETCHRIAAENGVMLREE
jgi:hypothetical protein